MNAKNNNKTQKLAIYQTRSGSIEIHQDFNKETFWATQKDLAFIYEKDQSVISRHINNVFKDKELDKKSNMQKMHIANSDKSVEFYSLDIILAIGYRINSSRAINFRRWATKTLKQHITKGFTINQNRINKNRQEFLRAVEDIKLLSKNNQNIQTEDILDLIKSFSYTWFSLDKYDKSSFPKTGTKKKINITSESLYKDLFQLKKELVSRGEASEMFSQEKNHGNLEGIIGNVFQNVFGIEVYETVEEKAAHLLYFVIKNHFKQSGFFFL